MTDKTLTCRDCGASFLFTVGEQEFYAGKGFTNEPTRCPECRTAHRRGQGGGYSGGSDRRQTFPAVCSQCGKDTQVPFQPRGDKPVYCSDCFESVRARSIGRGGRRSW